MNNIILSGGIRGIDWAESINLLVKANSNIDHFDNVMLKTKGKYDDLVLETRKINSADNKLKGLFKRHLTNILKGRKNPINFLSDPIFLDSGATWQTLNSDKTFAFFFCSPEYYLAKFDSNNNEEGILDEQTCLDSWLEDTNKIWDFYVRYPENTLLINVEDIERNPEISVSHILESFGVEDDFAQCDQLENSFDTARINPSERLALLLSQNMALETIKGSRAANELYENLALTSILADEALTYQVNERVAARLYECQGLFATIAARQSLLESESEVLVAANSELILDNEKLRASLSQFEIQKVELTAINEQVETLIAQQVTQHSQFEISLAKLASENKLSLLQIHKLQEDLEAKYLNAEGQEAKYATRNAELETSLAKLTSENELSLSLSLLQIHKLQEDLEAKYLNSEEQEAKYATRNAELETSLAKITPENELSLMQIIQLQEDLEAKHLNSEEQEAKYATRNVELETSLAKLTSENELSLMHINQLQEDLEAKNLKSDEQEAKYATHNAELEIGLAKLTSENELASLQKIQLQEELELTLANSTELSELNSQFEKRATALEVTKSEFAIRNSQLEMSHLEQTTEIELTLLQINQLKEELEYYYIQNQKMTYFPNRNSSYATDLNRVKHSLFLMNMN
jgi:hypothetical protein